MNDRMKQINKQLIAISKRRCKPGTGSQHKKGVDTMKNFSLDFLNIISVDFMMIGAYAAMTYMPARITENYDILIRIEDKFNVQKQIFENGGKLIKPLPIDGFLYNINEKEVNVVNCRETWFDLAYEEAPKVWDVKIIPLHYLILIKYQACRFIDLKDIYRILSLAKPQQLAKVRNIINKYLPEDLEDIESMIELGKIELQND